METTSVAGACYPFTMLPGLSRLFTDYIGGAAAGLYPVAPTGSSWMHHHSIAVTPNPTLADVLEAQAHACHAGPASIDHIARLRTGARAVVTGQQVGLFGGPLYTLYKAATAVWLAAEATRETGVPHVPIFWLATEDHDFAEIDHVALSGKLRGTGALETVRLNNHPERGSGAPVGALRLQAAVKEALTRAGILLGDSAELDLLRRCYRPEATFAGAFAQWLAATFREWGLIIFDAAGRSAHILGSHVLRRAITEAQTLENLLISQGQELKARGYHQQVLVKPGGSLLFLLEGGAENELHTRLPLKRRADGSWTAGHTAYTTAELLAILDREPERLSPNALLRPVFQDAILPTAAYIGGPAEIAYFAQTAVISQHILGRQTPVLPRLSATLLDARSAAVLKHDGIDLPEIFRMPGEELTQRVGARSLPPEGKRKLQAAGTAMTDELDALTGWMRAMDPDLGRSAEVAGSKMRHQMNRLRRLAAGWELQKNASIHRRIEGIYAEVYPGGHLQERSLGAAAALARYGARLPGILVEAAGDPCPGHKLIVL